MIVNSKSPVLPEGQHVACLDTTAFDSSILGLHKYLNFWEPIGASL
jgi:hypothetical protein